MSARTDRLGIPAHDRATRWALARTTTVIEDAGGLGRAACPSARPPGRPSAVLLVGTLFTLRDPCWAGYEPTAPRRPRPIRARDPWRDPEPDCRADRVAGPGADVLERADDGADARAHTFAGRLCGTDGHLPNLQGQVRRHPERNRRQVRYDLASDRGPQRHHGKSALRVGQILKIPMTRSCTVSAGNPGSRT